MRDVAAPTSCRLPTARSLKGTWPGSPTTCSATWGLSAWWGTRVCLEAGPDQTHTEVMCDGPLRLCRLAAEGPYGVRSCGCGTAEEHDQRTHLTGVHVAPRVLAAVVTRVAAFHTGPDEVPVLPIRERAGIVSDLVRLPPERWWPVLERQRTA